MEFCKDRVFTALNADELKQGDKVIVANQLSVLKQRVQEGKENSTIALQKINGEDWGRRFGLKMFDFALAYLVERAENCTNCEEAGKEGGCRRHGEIDKILCCDCYTPKTEQKAEEKNCYNCRLTYTRDGVMRCMMNDQRCNNPEVACNHYEPTTFEKHYRPFKDTDELIKVWEKKVPCNGYRPANTMPLIWVREKGCEKSADLITCYGSKGITVRGEGMYFDTLFTMFEFLDGSPCGVEE